MRSLGIGWKLAEVGQCESESDIGNWHMLCFKDPFSDLQGVQVLVPSFSTRPIISRPWSLVDLSVPPVIELDDGKIYRKALYLMVKPMGFLLRFSQENQSNDPGIRATLARFL